MRLMTSLLALAFAVAAIFTAGAQDPMRGLDLTSPDMTTAEMTRGQVEAALKAAPAGHGADFTGKRLSGLDLSGLDFSGANLRAARLNHTNLSHAKLDGANLDQAWALRSFSSSSGFEMNAVSTRIDGMSGAFSTAKPGLLDRCPCAAR